MKQATLFVLVLLLGAGLIGLADYGSAAKDDPNPQFAPDSPVYSPEYIAAKNQPQWCGTNEVWEMRQAEMGLTAPEAMACPLQGPCDVPATRDAIATDPIVVRVLFHSMHLDNGTGGADQAAVDATFAQMQADYFPYNILFENMGTRHHNDTANYCITAYGEGAWWLDIDNMKSLYAESPGTQCNVFISCQDTGTSGYLLGIATFPWDSVALTNLGGLWLNTTAVGAGTKTLSHEMGHCLGLWHTHHGVSEVTTCGACYEYASGVEGDVRGDFADDTPPTPTNYTCSPPGGSDCQGTPWGATQPENYMGYGPDWCYSLFTTKQMSRMFCWIDDELAGWRTYPCAALANFTADVTNGCVPFTVNFTDLSTGPVLSWLWDFGDGNTSILQNPTNVYMSSDTFTVTLTVSADTCVNAMTKDDYITVPGGVICDIQPTTLDFGGVEMGTYLDMPFIITNSGCDTLYGAVSEACVPYSIAAGAGAYAIPPLDSMVITVRYEPTVPTSQTCWIETGTTDCTDVYCTGAGITPPPRCSITPDTLDFGSVDVGGFSILTFDITNTGAGLLSGTVSETCDAFSFTTATTYALTAGQSQTIGVIFIASPAGSYECTIETGAAECVDVYCVGQAGSAAAVCDVEPDSLVFGTVLVGNYAEDSFFITNTGADTLSGTVSESCTDYSITAGSGPYQLASAESLTVTVRYAPATTGTHECTIETGDALCADVFCTGVGGDPPICFVDPDSLDFGTITENDSLDLAFYITNTGGDVLNGTVADTCSYFEVVSGAGPYSLANGDTVYVNVRFKPDIDGNFECEIPTGVDCADVYCEGIADPEGTGVLAQIPGKLTLYQNFPNPFNPSTTIAFWLPQKERVVLLIYDVNGALIRTLANEVLGEGINKYPWDGRDTNGNQVSSGVYFYRLKAGTNVLTRKMVLLK